MAGHYRFVALGRHLALTIIILSKKRDFLLSVNSSIFQLMFVFRTFYGRQMAAF